MKVEAGVRQDFPQTIPYFGIALRRPDPKKVLPSSAGIRPCQ